MKYIVTCSYWSPWGQHFLATVNKDSRLEGVNWCKNVSSNPFLLLYYTSGLTPQVASSAVHIYVGPGQ